MLSGGATSALPSGVVCVSAAARVFQYSTALLVKKIFGWFCRARSLSSRPSDRPLIGSRADALVNGKFVTLDAALALGMAPRSLIEIRPAPAMCAMTPSYTIRFFSSLLKPWYRKERRNRPD